MSKLLLKATDLEVSYGNGLAVFSNLNFSLEQGGYLGLSGPSGSGKTSLLKLCAGLFGLDHNPAVSGSLYYGEGLNLISADSRLRRDYRRDIVSMITENPRAGLHPQRSVRSSWKYYGMSSDLRSALARLGIKDLERIINAYPHELSGGEAQRVRLAFALSKQPNLLLLESPTAALDQLNADLVWEEVQRSKVLGTGVLHVDHNLKLLEKYADHRLSLGDPQGHFSSFQTSSVTLGEEVLAAAGVSVRYADFEAVKEVDLSLRAGEFVALLGPSGSGKSSLGKALSGIIPARGTLRIQGEGAAFAKTPYDRADTRVQYIWQEPRLSMNPRFTVFKTLRESIGPRSQSPEKLLEMVGLSAEKLHENTLALSTGGQQRLAIARALAVSPQVLVCDEITSGLDTDRATHVMDTLHRLRSKLGVAVLFITHDGELAQSHANRSLFMNEGQLVG